VNQHRFHQTPVAIVPEQHGVEPALPTWSEPIRTGKMVGVFENGTRIPAK